ncbi:MAG: hypothetical protein M1814_006054 [Vezdaea aestivalis]|nr:MAG: hypothetical protein M1814_006054 [Vezdaea aestivalis]
MAWGSSKPKAPPPLPSTFSKVFPLLLTFIVLGVLGWVGYQIFLTVTQITDRGVKKLEKKNVVFTKDGMKVGVKQVGNEEVLDKSQSLLVKAWNLSTWPAYKSRLWNKEQQETQARKPYSRSSSAASIPQ